MSQENKKLNEGKQIFYWLGRQSTIVTYDTIMRTDRYTKIVLSIIAFALIVLVFQQAFPVKNAVAQENVQKVAICDKTGQYCADVICDVLNFGLDKSVCTVSAKPIYPSSQ